MAENIRKSSTYLSSQMTVLEEGQSVARPSSGSGAVKKTTKKMPSEGLIVLSPEPGSVQFDDTVVRPASGGSRPGSRVGSAGRIEKKLQLGRKQDLSQEEPRRSSAEGSRSQGATKLHLPYDVNREPNNEPSVSKETRPDLESDSSDTNGDSDSSSADDRSADAGTYHSNHPGAPVELKGEFLKCIMDEDYKKAQQLCKDILLLEPDNATCREFHSVIHEKIKQDEEDEDDDDDDDDDDEDGEESEEESEESDDEEGEEGEEEESDDEEEDSEDEDADSESDEDVSVPSGPINLLMGGLPVRPQQR